MEVIRISSLNDLFNIIESLNNTYNCLSGQISFLYRGMNNSNYPLIPSILRKATNTYKDDDFTSITKYIYLDSNTEIEILREFIKEASCYLKEIPTTDYLRWAEYAQHFGVPTRLLDWTNNPFVAMFFACYDTNKSNEISDASLWILHQNNYYNFVRENSKYTKNHKGKRPTIKEASKELFIDCNKSLIDYPIIYTPYYVDQRMSAQSSSFMIWGNRNQPLEDLIPQKNYLSVLDCNGESIFSDKQNHEVLLKIIIPKESKYSLLKQLNSVGISEKTLFPGLDGVGKYIEQKFRSHFDEF